MTQVDRVLAALSRAGARGITAVDFAAPNVCDGGKPIMRVAARVKELRDAGFQIETDGERDSCAIYRLVLPDRLFETSLQITPAACGPYVDSNTSHWKAA